MKPTFGTQSGCPMNTPDEPRNWTELEADRVSEDLREQMRTAKARVKRMLEHMATTGRPVIEGDENDAGV